MVDNVDESNGVIVQEKFERVDLEMVEQIIRSIHRR
jgi:hypothetical protein